MFVPYMKSFKFGLDSLGITDNAKFIFSPYNRLTRKYTGKAIKVQRSSDYTSKNIEFNPDGTINQIELLDFCGSSDGLVEIVYNQFANNINAVQNTLEYKPKIVVAGIFQNSGLLFDGVDDFMELESDYANIDFNSFPFSIFSKFKNLDDAVGYIIAKNKDADDSLYSLFNLNDSMYFKLYGSTTVSTAFSRNKMESIIATYKDNATNGKLIKSEVSNNAATNFFSYSSGNVNTTIGAINKTTGKASFLNGHIKNLILFNTNEYNNFTEIGELDMSLTKLENNFYTVLDDYDGNNDIERLQAFCDSGITENVTLHLTRDIDLTGYSINIDKGYNYTTRIIGVNGAKLTKNDSGFMFTSTYDNPDRGLLRFENINFVGLSTQEPIVLNTARMIQIFFVDCQFSWIRCCFSELQKLQSLRIINCTISRHKGSFIKAQKAYDVHMLGNQIEGNATGSLIDLGYSTFAHICAIMVDFSHNLVQGYSVYPVVKASAGVYNLNISDNYSEANSYALLEFIDSAATGYGKLCFANVSNNLISNTGNTTIKGANYCGDDSVLNLHNNMCTGAGHILIDTTGLQNIKVNHDNTNYIGDGSLTNESTANLINYENTLVWNPASLADGVGELSSDITVVNASLGDFVIVSAPYDLQGVIATAYVSATDTVKIRLQNETGGTIDLAEGTWKVKVIK